MATGQNLQPGRGREVTNLSPQVDLRSNDAQAWQEAGRVFDRFREAAKPDLIRRAQARGGAEGAAIAAGEAEYRASAFQFGDVAAAREQALQSAFTARTRTDIEARDDELRREHRNQPEAYERAAAEMVSSFVQGAPPEFAVDVETFARARVSQGLSGIANARVARDDQEVVQALGIRADTLSERLIALGSDPTKGIFSQEYVDAYTEYSALQDDRANNPSILYSTEQMNADDDKLFDAIQTASVVRLSVEQFTASGGGLPGRAAALRYLDDELLNGEIGAGMAPERRQRVYRDASRQFNDFTVADREQRRAEAEAERARDAAARDAVGAFALRIATGDAVSRDEIEGNPLFDDAQRATLVRSADAALRRTEQDARRDAEIERSSATGAMANLRLEAREGYLTPGDIAGYINSGAISRAQGSDLQGLSDKNLRPLIDDLLAPSQDRARDRPNTSRQMMIAERAAIETARNSPNLTLEGRAAAGAVIRDRAFGAPTAGAPTTPAARDAQALSGRRAGYAEITRLRATGRPKASIRARQ